MGFTLKNLIDDEVIEGLELINGTRDFADDIISEVCVQEMPLDDFVNEGDIVLTTALGSENDPNYFDHLIRLAADAGAVAICFAFKMDMSVPQSAIDMADRCGLALFRIPWEVRFAKIQQDVASAVREYQAHAALAGILTYDRGNGSMELLKTLRAYINNNYNVSETARELYIHRQSLLARLQKIEDLTGMSLKDHDDLFELEVFARSIKDNVI